MLPNWETYFSTAEIAFNQFLAQNTAYEIIDDREMSIAQLDIRFNANSLETGLAIGYIATMAATTTFTKPDGNPAPGQFSGNITVG